MWKKIINRYRYLGYNYDVFKENEKLIRQRNLETLRYVTAIAMVMSLGLAIISLFSHKFAINMFFAIYAVLFVVVMILHILTTKQIKQHITTSERKYIYILFISVFIYSMIMGCYMHSDTSASAIWVFLVALPLFFVDRSTVVAIIQIATTITFIVVSYNTKSAYYSQIDMLNGFVFTTVAISLHYHTMRSKMRELESHRNLKLENDTDALTNILNRGGIEKYIEKYISKYSQDEDGTAVMILLDIDNFKGINDEFGHKAGDELLIETTKIMQEHFRKTDVYGRLGGDEFIIFLTKIKGYEWLYKKLDALVNAMERTLIGDTGIQRISASIGVVIFPENGSDFDILYRNADEAMYFAKKNGKSNYVFYNAIKAQEKK